MNVVELKGKTAYVTLKKPTVIEVASVSGPPGLDAYQVALNNGFVGTVDDWIDSLKGAGVYQLALDNGFVGTEEEFLDSLKATIPIGPQDEGLFLSNDGSRVVWRDVDLDKKLNEQTITWDLGEIN